MVSKSLDILNKLYSSQSDMFKLSMEAQVSIPISYISYMICGLKGLATHCRFSDIFTKKTSSLL